MPYYDAILTSTITVNTDYGTLDLPPGVRVLIQVGEQYILLGYYTPNNDLVYTLSQPIDGSILDEITQTLYDMSELSEAANPQGLDDQMLELPEAIVVPVLDDPGPQGLDDQNNQMLELPEAISVPDDPGPQVPDDPGPLPPQDLRGQAPEPVAEHEGLYRFRNIHLRL